MKCPHCGRDLPEEEFHRDRSRKSGYSFWCRDCKNARHMEYYYANHSRIRKQQNRYRTLRTLRTNGVRFPELKDEEWLRTEYLGKLKTADELAEELGCSPSTVRKALVRWGIPSLPKTLQLAFKASREAAKG